ncbi:hypothetical protein LTR94_026956, partial [Friedmanniomyces endolithicus]
AQDRTLMGADQEKWLYDGFASSKKAGTAWQILAQQVIMGYGRFPTNAADWVPANAPGIVRKTLAGAVAASQAGLPYNMDSWDGYPAARNRLYDAALAADADLVVLSGDSHNAWAYSLVEDGKPAGVEFAGQAVTSGGMEGDLRRDPMAVARGFIAANPELKWANTHQRGYMMIDISRDRVTGEWLFLDTIKARSTRIASTHRMSNMMRSAIVALLLLGSGLPARPASPVPPADLPREQIAGPFASGHVQGIAVDRKGGFIYYSFTDMLAKYDFEGRLVGTLTGWSGHLGDLDFNPVDRRVYGSLEYGKQSAFYIAMIDGARIDRVGMTVAGTDLLRAVYLPEVTRDYAADLDGDGKVDHRYGCSGIDGVAFGPAFGRSDGPHYLTVAYGIYSHDARSDNDHQVHLQYDATDR